MPAKVSESNYLPVQQVLTTASNVEVTVDVNVVVVDSVTLVVDVTAAGVTV